MQSESLGLETNLSIQMPMYRNDFYGPGQSAIYLSPRRYFPCTHIPSLLFSTISPPSVFHHFSSTFHFSSLKPPLGNTAISGKRPGMTQTLWKCHLTLRFSRCGCLEGPSNKPTSWAHAWPEAQKLFLLRKCYQNSGQTHTWMHNGSDKGNWEKLCGGGRAEY